LIESKLYKMSDLANILNTPISRVKYYYGLGFFAAIEKTNTGRLFFGEGALERLRSIVSMVDDDRMTLPEVAAYLEKQFGIVTKVDFVNHLSGSRKRRSMNKSNDSLLRIIKN
jgi:DNA-binding transcriptional MerR regulator